MLATPLVLEYFTLEERTNVYSSQVQVNQPANNSSLNIGLDAGRNLDFGVVPEGTNVTKKIRLVSSKPSLVTVEARGNISEYLYFDERFLLDGEKIFTIEIDPEDQGNYSGEVEIKIQTANSSLGEKWINIKSRF